MRKFLVALISFPFLISCGELLGPEYLPEVTTSDPMVYYTSAELGGTVTNSKWAESIGVFWGETKDDLNHYAEAKISNDGEYSVEVKSLKAGKQYWFQAVAKTKMKNYTGEIKSFITFPEGPVDLGLPSGLKWDSANVGAQFPTEYGGYYAWAETKEKSKYDWTSYKYCNGSMDSITKYYHGVGFDTRTDGNFVLTPEDDAAHVVLGGNWRTPTIDEWKELMENCTRLEIQVNGIRGTKFYNKLTDDITQFIFLPYSGYKDDTKIRVEGLDGYYWSASLRLIDNSFYSSYEGSNVNVSGSYVFLGGGARYFGESVRAVCR